MFCVGIGRADITPPIGTLLMGYTPPRPCVSVHDRLQITVFLFADGDTRALVASADLCNIRGEASVNVRKAMSEAAGVPYENCIIACTHTHSGPHTVRDPDEPPCYVRAILIPAAAAAAKAAAEALKPAQMGIGTVQSKVAINRRQLREDGKVLLGQNPYGPMDPTMTVIAFREPDGTPIGNLIHYGCHNTGSGKNDAVTRDWCGVAVDRLEALSKGMTGFINGGAGDCGPRLANGGTTGNLSMALELGGQAACDAAAAWRSIRQWHTPRLYTIQGIIRLPLNNTDTPEGLISEAQKLGDPETLTGTVLYNYKSLIERAERLQAGFVPEEAMDIPHTAICLDSLALLGMPFEPFSLVTLRVKDASPFLHTLCVGYANGSMSYFPSMDQLIRGGYEVRMFRTFHDVPFTDDAEQHYVAGCLQLLRQLHSKAADN